MNRKTSVVVLLLLAVSISLIGAAMPEQAQASKALPGCPNVGCDGGPDLCFTLTVKHGTIYISYHCYARILNPLQ
jgi:hypothetical protein